VRVDVDVAVLYARGHRRYQGGCSAADSRPRSEQPPRTISCPSPRAALNAVFALDLVTGVDARRNGYDSKLLRGLEYAQFSRSVVLRHPNEMLSNTSMEVIDRSSFAWERCHNSSLHANCRNRLNNNLCRSLVSTTSYPIMQLLYQQPGGRVPYRIVRCTVLEVPVRKYVLDLKRCYNSVAANIYNLKSNFQMQQNTLSLLNTILGRALGIHTESPMSDRTK
jgi:hypothetical protein